MVQSPPTTKVPGQSRGGSRTHVGVVDFKPPSLCFYKAQVVSKVYRGPQMYNHGIQLVVARFLKEVGEATAPGHTGKSRPYELPHAVIQLRERARGRGSVHARRSNTRRKWEGNNNPSTCEKQSNKEPADGQ